MRWSRSTPLVGNEALGWWRCSRPNAIVREEAARYGDRVLHVDLDLEVTGAHDEFFVDLGHMNGPGISFKARAIGDAILDHWTRRRQPR